jgi:CheY-like chemotaxis protein
MRARVLIVHDVPVMRAVVSQALEHQGCTAIGAEGFAAASALSAIDPPDVIVVDERLIDADPDAFRAMRDRFPKVVVVGLSAPLRRRGPKPIGVDCAVEKPPHDLQLARAIRWALAVAGSDTTEAKA